MAEPVITYLGLGGNLGDRLAALTEALALLDATPGMRMLSCSSVYETEPWGVVDQPQFLNLVVGFETTLSPSELLTVCKRVEFQVGRTESYRWGPRRIDVDVLLYGDAVVNSVTPDLQIPHLRLHQRAFVLIPLAEIAPDAVVPGLDEQMLQLLSKVDGKEGVIRQGDAPVST